jgi:hypothetical protein
MSIIQISKIQQRSGDLVDLPQLDQAEFGFAADVNRLFIGKTTGNTENIEVLTAYSDIAFSQIEGAIGNLDISANVANGEVLVFDGSNWVNRGGNAGGYINLGEVSNVAIEGGGIGYVLTTDGSGGLNWSPKGIVTQDIQEISASSTARMTLVEPYPFAEGTEITINMIGSSDFDVLNSNVYYLKSVAGNIQLYDLYTDTGLLSPVNTSAFGSYPTNTGIIIFNTVTANGGLVAGTTYSVQYNSGTDFAGDASFLYNYTTNTLIVPNISTGSSSTQGNITGNWTLTAGSRLQSTYADLAEYYSSDANYAAGTVLAFGGQFEVTVAGIETNKVAGVASADPAYVMNGMIKCEHPVAIALQGRVPCKVKGKVRKGDMMISAGGGFAKAAITSPNMGTVIGKALQDFDGEEGIIEVVVGRL